MRWLLSGILALLLLAPTMAGAQVGEDIDTVRDLDFVAVYDFREQAPVPTRSGSKVIHWKNAPFPEQIRLTAVVTSDGVVEQVTLAVTRELAGHLARMDLLVMEMMAYFLEQMVPPGADDATEDFRRLLARRDLSGYVDGKLRNPWMEVFIGRRTEHVQRFPRAVFLLSNQDLDSAPWLVADVRLAPQK